MAASIPIIDIGRLGRLASTYAGTAERPLSDVQRLGITEAVTRLDSAAKYAITSLDGVESALGGVDELLAARTHLAGTQSALSGTLDATRAVAELKLAAAAFSRADTLLLSAPGVHRISPETSTMLLQGSERAEAAARAAGLHRAPGTQLSPAVREWTDLRIHRFLQKLGRLFVQPIYNRLVHVHGAHNVPARGGVELLGTHGSDFDPMLVSMSQKRPFRLMLLREPFDTAARGAIRAIGGFPIDRSGGEAAKVGLAVGRQVLEDGRLLTLFPEGMVHGMPGLIESKHGAATLGTQTGAAVVVTASVGFEPALVRAGIKGKGKHIVIGEPMYFRQVEHPTQQQTREVQELIQQEAERLHNRARGYYEAGARSKRR